MNRRKVSRYDSGRTGIRFVLASSTEAAPPFKDNPSSFDPAV